MKLDANIEWVIDDKELGIASGTEEIATVDVDYVSGNEFDVIEWVENELYNKYGTILKHSYNESDGGDFVIKNLQDIVDDIKMEEYEEAMSKWN